MYSILGRSDDHPYNKETPPHKVTFEMLKKNKTFIKDFGKWMLAEAAPKYDYAKEHLILRNNSLGGPNQMGTNIPQRSELRKILDGYSKKGFTIVINPPQDKSIPNQQHIHLLKFKKFDKKSLHKKIHPSESLLGEY